MPPNPATPLRPLGAALAALAVAALSGCESLPGSDARRVPEPPVIVRIGERPPESASGAALAPNSDWRDLDGPVFAWTAPDSAARPETPTESAGLESPTAQPRQAAEASVADADAAVGRAPFGWLRFDLGDLSPADEDEMPPPAADPEPAAPDVEQQSPAPVEERRATPPLASAAPATADWRLIDGPVFDWPGTPPVPPPAAVVDPDDPWQQRLRRVRAVPGWSLNGRVAVTAPDESWNAVVRWQQQGDAFSVRLSNALGQGLVDLRGVPGEVYLRTAEGEVYRAEDAESLLRGVAGLDLPVSGLRYWVLAVSDPSLAAGDVTLGADALPVELEQAGWRVEYDRYRETGGVSLPDRLSFSGNDLRGRVIITQWQVHGG